MPKTKMEPIHNPCYMKGCNTRATTTVYAEEQYSNSTETYWDYHGDFCKRHARDIAKAIEDE